jgi:membrane protease YdiL (CAAX protease family)
MVTSVGPLVVFFLIAVAAGGGAAGRDLDDMSGLPQLGVPAVFAVLVVVNGYGEEGGWRGFLLPWFRARLALLPACLAVTAVWAAWHIPLFFLLRSYQGFGALTLVGFLVGLAAGALVLGSLYERTGSVLVVAVWHATYNLLAATGDSALRASVVSAGVIVWAVAIARQTGRVRSDALT